jgi:hypothetical protein
VTEGGWFGAGVGVGERVGIGAGVGDGFDEGTAGVRLTPVAAVGDRDPPQPANRPPMKQTSARIGRILLICALVSATSVPQSIAARSISIAAWWRP